MDHERCEESRQTSLDFRCKKIIQSSGKLHVEPCSDAMSGIKDNEVKLDSPTPEKLDLPPRTHQMRKIIFTETSGGKHVPQVELPEKYKNLADFFNRMETSVRLLRLRKKLSSFENISTQVEVLTKRRFLYSHLAQIKYIFPDALKIEPVLVHDERSLCMKPDMKITLLLNVADDHSNGSLSLAYCKAFHAKLLEFYNTHPECDDVPEAELPESFNLGNFMTQQESSALVSSMKLSLPAPTNPEPSISSSHLSHSFCRQFSQKILVPESEMTHFQTSQTSRVYLSTSGTNSNEPQSPENKGIPCNATVKSCSPTQLISINLSHILSLDSSEVRSVKPILTQDKSFIVTPAQSIPKRALVTPDDGNLSFETESCKAKRSLSFQDQDKSKVSVCMTEANREVDDCGHQMIETQKILVGEETPRYMYTHLQEAKEIENGLKNNEGFQETGLVKRQQMLAYLPELFYTVRHVFQSTKCSVITKQELIHKILFHDCNIEETREAEELLGLLEELVPDWICGRTVSTGDFLYRIQKTCDPESIRVRLVDAII